MPGPHGFAVRDTPGFALTAPPDTTPVVCTLCPLTSKARPATTTRARRCRVHRNLSLVRDDGRRPSWRDRMAGVVRLIWGRGEAECFFGRDWTGGIALI